MSCDDISDRVAKLEDSQRAVVIGLQAAFGDPAAEEILKAQKETAQWQKLAKHQADLQRAHSEVLFEVAFALGINVHKHRNPISKRVLLNAIKRAKAKK